MRSGQVALPHGYGQDYPGADGERRNNGPRVNWLTDSGNRDPIADTPHHKHVPVRLERRPTPRRPPTRRSRSASTGRRPSRDDCSGAFPHRP